ncbi:hypothetical protein PSHT_08708 [Puccinia striiformis]|uniref:FAD-binding FR-type domain-containing protein n=1 Tax=Puccinia striiformis TaxID=27350 RepID=A0A2S4VM45_9BASI|nr:hypothetical protein PSHT_08708 [Puccinia striiformis]
MERRLSILYGSQNGTAGDLAHQLARGARRVHFKTEVSSMDNYDRDELFDEDLVVYSCLTTGQGVQPSNMTQVDSALLPWLDGLWSKLLEIKPLPMDHTLDFVPGAVCEIWPQNSDLNILNLFKLMIWDHSSDQVFKIFITKLDFTSVPNRLFTEWISHFTTDTLEREKLIKFCLMEGQDDLYDYITKSRWTISAVLSEFKSTKIPIEYIFDVFPPIRPCQFLISSSSKIFPNQIHLLVAILNYRTRLSVPQKGLCTTWLAGLEIGTRIQIGISEGYVRFPSDPKQLIICIGPGTGITPFQSLIQEQQSFTSHNDDHQHQPNTLVFSGCRGLNHPRMGFVSSFGPLLGIRKVCASQGGFNQSQSEAYIDKLEVLGKLQEDTWS